MAVTQEPFTPVYIQMGYEEHGLQTELVSAVVISRDAFIECVEQALSRSEDYEAIADEMRRLARTIPRFPLDTWIDPTRGCGCMVGEYLVAQPEIDRYNLAVEVGNNPQAIETMLRHRPNGDVLIQFGRIIDHVVRGMLADRGVRRPAIFGDTRWPAVAHEHGDIDAYVSVVVIEDQP